MTMNEHMMASPTWLLIWLGIMGLTVLLAIPFAIKDWRARWAIIAMIGNVIVMSALFEKFGFTRILGLAHIIFWTPLLAYLWKNRKTYPERIWTNRWVRLAMIVILTSLLFDYTDVIRWLFGERGVVSYA
jgi:hypothetical protein